MSRRSDYGITIPGHRRQARVLRRFPIPFVSTVLPVLGMAVCAQAVMAAAPLPAGAFAPAVATSRNGSAARQSLPAGTTLYVRLETAVSSAASKVNQKVRAKVVRQVFVNSGVVIPLGAELEGNIEKLHASQRPDDPAVMLIHFTELQLPGEKPAAVSCHLLKVENARETIFKDGTIQGVRASDLGSSYINSGLNKLAQQLPSLSSVIGNFRKKQIGTPDTSISYPAGTDMLVALDKPLPVVKFFAPAAAMQLPSAALSAVRQVLAKAPQRSSTQKNTPGDPLNLVIIGNEQQIRHAFGEAGWDIPAEKRQQSILKTVEAVTKGEGYDVAPISNLYLYNRPQDLAFEKVLNTFAMRHHLRLWKFPVRTPEGQEAWLGAAVHDTGFDIHPGVASHATDPDLDAERAKVGADLLATGFVSAEQLVKPPHPLSHGVTGTGGAWETDGKLLAIDLKSVD